MLGPPKIEGGTHKIPKIDQTELKRDLTFLLFAHFKVFFKMLGPPKIEGGTF